MKKLLCSAMAAFLLLGTSQTHAQQVSEKLNRAPVAVKTSQGILVSWRSLKEDAAGTSFSIYRNGKQIARDISDRTNFLDAEGSPKDTYRIETVSNGKVTGHEQTVAWSSMFTTLTLNRPESNTTIDGKTAYYRPDDMSVGDLDGDGTYELVLKWMPSNQRDNSQSSYTSPTILAAYKMDGTQLWRINLGSNIRSGQHYTQFLVYDLDGDGKAEVVCKTAPGSVDGKGHYVTKAGTENAVKKADNSKTYVNPKGHIYGGEEFLTVFNGKTGAAMHTIFYSPARSGEDFVHEATLYGGSNHDHRVWEDLSYNRGERYNAAVAYLDGYDKLPTAILQRGYYSRCYLWAVDWNGKTLSTRWLHRSIHRDAWSVVDGEGNILSQGSGKSSYSQGNHSIAVADVNGDGYDEIVTGPSTIAHDGSLLCTTGMGHGDAIHLTDLCPDRPGLEVMVPHEARPYGYDVHDATTGEVLCSATGHDDNGRALACDFIPWHKGSEFWSALDRVIRDCATGDTLLQTRADLNYRIYWTGDPYDQTFDGRYSTSHRRHYPRICNFNTETNDVSVFQTLTGYGSPEACSGTKATPCLQADILGDWREELILFQHSDDPNSKTCNLLIYSTPEPTQYKVPCLMQDHVYRMGIVWQNSTYNQPPHLGYSLPAYLGIDGKQYKTQRVSHAPEVLTPQDYPAQQTEYFEP
jgi:rhamnogalacturonan endolyase